MTRKIKLQTCCYCKNVIPGMRFRTDNIAAHHECLWEAENVRLGWPDRQKEVHSEVAVSVALELGKPVFALIS